MRERKQQGAAMPATPTETKTAEHSVDPRLILSEQSGIIPFQFNQQHDVRVFSDDHGEPWFVASDVARLLGYQRSRDAIKQHCRGAVKHRLPTSSGIQDTQLIPERDVYRLIMRSKLPAAEAFEDWVVSEVLPQIRKTGAYSHPIVPTLPTLAESLRLAADLAEKNECLQVDSEALHRLSNAEGSFTPTEACKPLQIRRKELLQWLEDNTWAKRNRNDGVWIAMAHRISQGHLIQKSRVITLPDGRDRTTSQILITAKGLALIAKRLTAEAE